MQVERVKATDFVISPMPDGSCIIRDPGNENVFALNSTAGAAWDACASANTITGVAEEMRRSFDPSVTDELAEASIVELQKKNLVIISGVEARATRRQMLVGLGAVALPLVASLTLGEQKAHAQRASSADPDEHEKSRPHSDVPKNHKHDNW